ncbi:hypothetical protein KJ782_07310 [Patescibacteria group bacterium]|nr:hypothetical protein [Patescibacteria group bacterium]
MAIQVTVTEQCSRCQRKEDIQISSDDLAAFEARAEAQKAAKQRVVEFAEDHPGQLPDLVVIFNGQVYTFSTVCDAHCKSPVQNAIEGLFRERQPRKPRGPRKSPEEHSAAAKTPEAEPSNGAKSDSKKTDKKGSKTATAPAG